MVLKILPGDVMGLFKSKVLETLRSENEELKTKFHFMYEKEQSAKKLEEIVRNLREEATHLGAEKSELTEAIRALQNDVVDKKEQARTLHNNLTSLQEIKDDLQNTILSYSNQVDDFEGMIKEAKDQKDSIAGEVRAKNKLLGEFEERKGEYDKQIGDLKIKIDELQKLKEDLIVKQDAKLLEISEIEERIIRQNETNIDLHHYADELSEKIAGLHTKEMLLNDNLELKQKQLIELTEQITETEYQFKTLKESIVELRLDEEDIQTRLKNLNAVLMARREEINSAISAEKQRREEELQENFKELEQKYIEEIESKNIETSRLLEIKQTQLAELEETFSSKKEEYEKYIAELNLREEEIGKIELLLSNLNKGRDQLILDTGEKEKEIFNLDQTLRIKAEKLHKVNLDISEAEKRISDANEEVTKALLYKEEMSAEVNLQQEKTKQLDVEQKKLEELIPLLEKRKTEIEKSNAELESRFTKMFQKFTAELTEINKKRNILEQVVLKKERDLEERDQDLFEKIASLEESERIINIRQAELDSIEDSLRNIKDQKEILLKDLRQFESQTFERKQFNDSIRIETELLLEKKAAIEKTMQELLNMMIDGYSKGKDRRNKLEKEVKEYEEQLTDYRSRIDESINRLEDVQSSLTSAKIEFEELKGNAAKMLALKKRLQEQINKHQSALGRYQKLREKIKSELAIPAKEEPLNRER